MKHTKQNLKNKSYYYNLVTSYNKGRGDTSAMLTRVSGLDVPLHLFNDMVKGRVSVGRAFLAYNNPLTVVEEIAIKTEAITDYLYLTKTDEEQAKELRDFNNSLCLNGELIHIFCRMLDTLIEAYSKYFRDKHPRARESYSEAVNIYLKLLNKHKDFWALDMALIQPLVHVDSVDFWAVIEYISSKVYDIVKLDQREVIKMQRWLKAVLEMPCFSFEEILQVVNVKRESPCNIMALTLNDIGELYNNENL